MTDVKIVEKKLAGNAEAKRRRGKILADLARVFCDSGPQAVADEMTRRMDALTDASADHLRELKKQL